MVNASKFFKHHQKALILKADSPADVAGQLVIPHENLTAKSDSIADDIVFSTKLKVAHIFPGSIMVSSPPQRSGEGIQWPAFDRMHRPRQFRCNGVPCVLKDRGANVIPSPTI